MNTAMRKILATMTAITAGLGILAVASPADAATRTLASGVYVTPAGRKLDLMPKWAPVANPGTYKTSGRPKNRTCMLRAVDMWDTEVANVILAYARSYTVKIPSSAVLVEVAGPCKWVRK